MPSTPLEGSVLAKQTTRSAIGAAGDPGLAAVQDPAVAVAHGARLHAEDIGAGPGLAGGVGPEQPAVAEARQVALFLGLGAERQDRHGDRPDRGTRAENQARVGTAVAQSLDGRDGRRQVLALAAVFGRDGQAQDAEPRTSLVTLAPELAALFPARGVGIDQLFPGEPQGRVVPMLLSFREGKIHHRVHLV